MAIVKSRLFGGEGGTPFNESVSHIARIERIIALILRGDALT